jgi:hypothetical protein
MKLLTTTLAVSIALATLAFSAQAAVADQGERDLQACLAELRGVYGEETDLQLVDRRRNQHGTRMRVAAKLDADNTYFANCWVARYDEGDPVFDDEGQALAATVPMLIER